MTNTFEVVSFFAEPVIIIYMCHHKRFGVGLSLALTPNFSCVNNDDGTPLTFQRFARYASATHTATKPLKRLKSRWARFHPAEAGC